MKFIYFISNFIPVLLALLIIWHKTIIYRKIDSNFKKNLLILLILGLFGLVNALGEGLALKWGIWYYNDSRNLGIKFFNVYLETYIYCVLVPVTIGSAAIKFAERQDKKYGR
jgi:hypothetical protein